MHVLIRVILLLFISTYAKAREPMSDEDLQQMVNDFTYEATYSVENLTQNNRETAACQKFSLQLKADFPGNTGEPIVFDINLYRTNPKITEGAAIPAVIQLPPMGGVNVLDRWMGNDLCRNKMASFIIKTDLSGFDFGKDLPPVEDHNQAFLRTTAAIKATMAYIDDDEHYAGDKIGIFGVSLGGILGSFSYGILDDLAAGFFLVSGSDSPFILAHSQQDRVVKLRRMRKQEQGIETNQEYEAYLREHLIYDSFDSGRRVPKEISLMIGSNKDKDVPSTQQTQLHEIMNEPEVYFMNSGHVGTVIDTLLWGSNRGEIVEFYKKRFAEENPRLNRGTQEFLDQFKIAANN